MSAPKKSPFSKALEEVMEHQFDGKQFLMADTTGQSNGSLSRWISGDRRPPSGEKLGELVKSLDKHSAKKIVQGWLQTVCPAPWNARVKLS